MRARRRCDDGEVLLGRGQQVLALASALAGEIRIAADDEPLARIIGRGDGRHVAVVEQRHLQGSGVRKLPDRRRLQRRDPVEPRRGDLGVDARLRDHSAVADQHHMIKREALLDLVDLCGERARIGGIALECLDRHRAAVSRAQQAVDDLQLALLAVAVVAALRQFAAAALQIARRHVVEHQRAGAQMLARERPLDRLLALAQPVEGDVEFVFVNRSKTEASRQG